jgi:hypothetical protein
MILFCYKEKNNLIYFYILFNSPLKENIEINRTLGSLVLFCQVCTNKTCPCFLFTSLARSMMVYSLWRQQESDAFSCMLFLGISLSPYTHTPVQSIKMRARNRRTIIAMRERAREISTSSTCMSQSVGAHKIALTETNTR